MKYLLLILFTCAGLPSIQANERQAIEAEIKANPEAPKPYVTKAQWLFKQGQPEEAIATAATAMAKFEQANIDLSWIILGSVEFEKKRIDVHFNMSPKERHTPEFGIVRPLSFRVWQTKPNEDFPTALLGIYDFEIGVVNGAFSTFAIGQYTNGEHHNYGTYPERPSFEVIIERVKELIRDK